MSLHLDHSPKEWNRRPEILLSPQIPKPMHCVAPRIVLGKEWWDKTRKTAYASTNWHCLACGVYRRSNKAGPLHGHEFYTIDYLMGRMYYQETVPLCNYCHDFIHLGRLEMLRRIGIVTDEYYQRVVTHGNWTLKTLGITKPLPYDGPMADWGDWRMVAFEKEYYPRFKNESEWATYFNQT